ncbi:MAG TPA: hypothetical protein EYP30_03660 [Archaeoglobaceae archaeon]|nr:hypothetical protein [Archaeoglobaceae archaeon]
MDLKVLKAVGNYTDIVGIPILVAIIGIGGILMWFPHWFVSGNPALFFTFRTIHTFFAIFFLNNIGRNLQSCKKIFNIN